MMEDLLSRPAPPVPTPGAASSQTAIIPQQDGVLIQDLPFTIQLKK